MGEDTKFWISTIVVIVIAITGLIRWAIAQHEKLREDMTAQIVALSKEISKSNSDTRDRVDVCANSLKLELSKKVDKDSFERVTERLFQMMDAQREQMISIITDWRRKNGNSDRG